MKTSELAGALLDYWVAKAEGKGAYIAGYCFLNPPDNNSGTAYKPSEEWAQGGPIIERESISIQTTFNGWMQQFWCATAGGYGFVGDEKRSYGLTPLVAAMRAYVASKFGDEVSE